MRGDVEKYGTGFIRIRKFLADCPNIKLELIPWGDFFKTVITDLKVTPQVTPQVEKLVMVMEGIMTREEMQRKLALSDREYFRTKYLIPAIKNGIIKMTIPDKPKSKNQKYRLTIKGNEYKINRLLTDYKNITDKILRCLRRGSSFLKVKMDKIFIIAEAGVNHNGKVELAYKLIDVAAEAGADAVKFQTFEAEKFRADYL